MIENEKIKKIYKKKSEKLLKYNRVYLKKIVP